MQKMHSKTIRRLYRAVAQIRDEKECAAFFEDLCTVKEIQDMAKRLDAAVLLEAGMNYQQIAKEADISTATISRVSKCLNYGSGGYRAALDRLKDTEGTK
ncbi:MAG: TrpR-related protein YerC/YecD [Oscillibacter sp.]|nr:TrpR-related protein YerC/YecD [Oscillibacter sp.]